MSYAILTHTPWGRSYITPLLPMRQWSHRGWPAQGHQLINGCIRVWTWAPGSLERRLQTCHLNVLTFHSPFTNSTLTSDPIILMEQPWWVSDNFHFRGDITQVSLDLTSWSNSVLLTCTSCIPLFWGTVLPCFPPTSLPALSLAPVLVSFSYHIHLKVDVPQGWSQVSFIFPSYAMFSP